MGWSICRDADDFLDRRREYLVNHESLNCLAWSAIGRSKEQSVQQAGAKFFIFEKDGGSIAHAFIREGRGTIVLSPMETGQATELSHFLDRHGIFLTIAEGPREATLSFAAGFEESNQASHFIKMNQGLYEITRVKMPETNGGKMITGGPEHRTLLEAFLKGFCLECFPDDTFTPDIISNRVKRLLEHEKAFLWESEAANLVSMASVVRESPHGASISLVYTPAEHRGHGYAASLMATLSQSLLNSGKKTCNLFTDLGNAASNRVYTKVGYSRIAESIRIQFSSDNSVK